MKIWGVMAVLALVPWTALADDVEQRDIPAYAQEARGVIQQFKKQLGGALKHAMQEGGPLQAVEVCHEKAPLIAQDISEKTGWQVGRTSLKARNADNQPSEQEVVVLTQFEQEKRAGKDTAMLEWWQSLEVVQGEQTQTVVHYMKAIPTGGVCVTCHGDHVNPKLKAKIDALYPEDAATGFKAGDIRGAFTLQKIQVKH